jgi:hypothetical protein
MSPENLNIISTLLAMLADRLSADSCNDFDLSLFIPSPEARQSLMKKYHEFNGDPEEFVPDESYEIVNNSSLASYFSDLILQELSN